MNFSFIIDWKFIVALGVVAGITIFSLKMDTDSAEKVSTHVADACKEYFVARNSEQ